MSLAGRHIVFALDLKDDSHQALLWLLKHIYKPGDVVHLVHVAKLKVGMRCCPWSPAPSEMEAALEPAIHRYIEMPSGVQDETPEIFHGLSSVLPHRRVESLQRI